MTVDELAQAIKTKYPDYGDMDNTELVNRITAKYPEYKDHLDAQPTTPEAGLPKDASVGDFALNAMSDLGKTAVGMINPLNYMGQVYKGAYQLPKDITQSIAQKSAETVTGKDYGPTPITQDINKDIVSHPLVQDPIKEAYENPVSTALTLSTPFTAFHPGVQKAISSSVNDISTKAASLLADLKPIADKIKGTFEIPPSPQEIQIAVSNLQKAVVNTRKSIGQELGSLTGAQKTLIEGMKDIAKGETGPTDVESLAQEWLQRFEQPKTATQINAPVMEEAASPVTAYVKAVQKGYKGSPDIPIYGIKGAPEEIAKLGYGPDPASVPENIIRQKGIPIEGEEPSMSAAKETVDIKNRQELHDLLDLKKRMSDTQKKGILDKSSKQIRPINSVEGGMISKAIEAIDNRIGQLPEGQKILALNKKYSDTATIYNDLRTQLESPGKAESFLRRVFTSKDPRYSDYRNQLVKLDQLSGTNVTETLFNLFKRESKGLTLSEIRHPFNTLVNIGAPPIQSAIRMIPSTAKSAPMAGFPLAQITPSGVSNLQSLRDRLANAQ